MILKTQKNGELQQALRTTFNELVDFTIGATGPFPSPRFMEYERPEASGTCVRIFDHSHSGFPHALGSSIPFSLDC